MTNQLLTGVKVLELASVLAGPSVGMFLAELGATVLKIENPHAHGDVTRSWKLPNENKAATVSAYFSAINYGKQYQAVDLKLEAGKATVYNLIKEYDIVLTNFKPGDAEKLGLSYSNFKAIKPNIIHGNISGYGEYVHRAAYDVIIQAETGYMYMNGEPHGAPLKMPIALMDMLAAHQLKQGLLLALLHRERTGEGCYVSASLFDAGIAALTNQACSWLMAGHLPVATGSLHPSIAPYGDTLYGSDNLPLVLAVGSDEQFRHLCEVLGTEELPLNHLFAHNQARVVNRQALIQVLQQQAAKYTRDYLLQALIAKNVPCGAIRNLQEVFNEEAAQKLVLEEMIDGVKTKRPASVAFKITQK